MKFMSQFQNDLLDMLEARLSRLENMHSDWSSFLHHFYTTSPCFMLIKMRLFIAFLSYFSGPIFYGEEGSILVIFKGIKGVI